MTEWIVREPLATGYALLAANPEITHLDTESLAKEPSNVAAVCTEM